MFKNKLAVVATTCLLPICAAAVEQTVSQSISRVLYDGASDYLYVVGAGNWGASSCPNAYYVQVPATVPGRKQLMAAVLAAKAAGQSVQFQGTCGTHPNYFDATYILID
jgi:hypothetical protein